MPLPSLSQTYSTQSQSPQQLIIRHPAKMKDDIVYVKQTQYFIALLKLALSKSAVQNQTNAVEVPAVIDSRYALMLESDIFDVIWIHTNKAYEKRLQPIRIPLFKGLIGWRVFAVRKDNLHTFSTIKSNEALKELFAGQGYDWPDTAILKNNNFNLTTSVHPSNLYGMLAAKRLDYFPRSILEVHYELLQDNRTELLTVEPTLALQYPTAFYFYVKKDNRKLANIIEKGLEKAITDGSFDKLFLKYFGEEIKNYRFDQRTVFTLYEPKEMFSHLPLDRKELWFKTTKR
jgi:hypothetical protein